MEDIRTYQIELHGQVDPNDLNTTSPQKMDLVQRSQNNTVLAIHTDQSGLIGLLRHLHARGIVFLSIKASSE